MKKSIDQIINQSNIGEKIFNNTVNNVLTTGVAIVGAFVFVLFILV